MQLPTKEDTFECNRFDQYTENRKENRKRLMAAWKYYRKVLIYCTIPPPTHNRAIVKK